MPNDILLRRIKLTKPILLYSTFPSNLEKDRNKVDSKLLYSHPNYFGLIIKIKIIED